MPAGLPPFPGSGWVYDTPTSDSVKARAQYWNSRLWDFPSRRIVQPFVIEQFGGRWLAFRAEWMPGDKGPQTFMGTTASRLATAAPIVTPPAPGAPLAAPAAAPAPAAPAAGNPSVPSPIAAPPPPRPQPATPSAYAPSVVAPVAPPPKPMSARQIQDALNKLAPSPPAVPFPLVVDGNLGALLTPAQVAQALAGKLDVRTGHKSRLAIVQYQHAKGLRTDSDAGPQTQAHLLADLSAAGLPVGSP